MELVSVEQVVAARELLRGVLRETPVTFSSVLAATNDGPVYLKCENLQRTGSFKIRGAYVRIHGLTEAERAAGVVAASAGNHAQGVALGASLHGTKATVFMPNKAPLPKIAATRSYGAQVHLHGATFDETLAKARAFADATGAVFIHPFDHPDVIAGQGTVGLEIAAQCPDVDLVAVPISGGGLISGIAAAVKATHPGARVIGVEPELAADARDSFRRGERVTWPASETQRTIADALRVEQIGALPFEHIRALVDDVVTVTEDEIRAAMRRTAAQAHLVAEPGGAVAIAACLSGRDLPEARAPVAVLSGGNVDPALFAAILAAGRAPRPARLCSLCVPPLPTPECGSCCSSRR